MQIHVTDVVLLERLGFQREHRDSDYHDYMRHECLSGGDCIEENVTFDVSAGEFYNYVEIRDADGDTTFKSDRECRSTNVALVIADCARSRESLKRKWLTTDNRQLTTDNRI